MRPGESCAYIASRGKHACAMRGKANSSAVQQRRSRMRKACHRICSLALERLAQRHRFKDACHLDETDEDPKHEAVRPTLARRHRDNLDEDGVTRPLLHQITTRQHTGAHVLCTALLTTLPTLPSVSPLASLTALSLSFHRGRPQAVSFFHRGSTWTGSDVRTPC